MPFAETPLARPAIGIQRLAAFNWGWTNPSPSNLLAPAPQVATLVAVSSPDRWQPFDPTDPAALPRIPGIDYTAYLAALRRQAAR